MLWYVGYGQRPFVAIPTIGYDNVMPEFKSIAGENRALLNEKVKSTILQYLSWSDSKNFWFFWKPALISYIGLFIILFRITLKRDSGLILVYLLPLSLTFVLAMVIPFPAYRYQYPVVLLMSSLCTLAFARSNLQKSNIG